MAETMNLVDLVASLKASLHDAGKVFVADGALPDAAFERFLRQALPDMQLKRPVTRLGTVTLNANVPRYALGSNAGFAGLKTQLWGERCRFKPWEPGYPGALPRVSASFDANQWWLDFERAPTALQIAAHGSQFDFWFFAAHAIGADVAATTLNAQDRGLLILRAQVEAMRELAIRNAAKPVQLRDGLSGTPRNSTPAALADSLMRTFVEAR